MATNVATSAINSINLRGLVTGGDAFDEDAFGKGAFGRDAMAGVAAGMAGNAVTVGMGKINLSDANKVTLNDYTFDTAALKSFNRFAGSIASTGVTYGLTGNAKVNLLNASMFGLTNKNGDPVSVGLFEFGFGKDGVQAGIGMGGTDMSLGTIAAAIRGMRESNKVIDWKYGSEKQQSDLNAINMLGWTGEKGNGFNVALSRDIWNGKIRTRYEDMGANDHGYYDRAQNSNEIVLSNALLGGGKDAAAKLATVMSHEGTHVYGNRVEGIAHQQGLATYGQIASICKIDMDSEFTNSMVDAICDIGSWTENEGSRDNWELTRRTDGSVGWSWDESLDFNIDGVGTITAENMKRYISAMKEIEANSLVTQTAIGTNNQEQQTISNGSPGKNFMDSLLEGYMGNDPEKLRTFSDFLGGTEAFADASIIARQLIDQKLSPDGIDNLNSAMMRAQNSGLLVKNPPGQIDTSRLINLGTENDPLFVPVELGPGQNVHETSSYPGYRLRNIAKGYTGHSGIDLRGIHDSNVVASANDSSVSLMYDKVFGLFAMNSYEYGGIQHKDQLSHLEAPQTVMAYLNNFGTEGVSFDGTTMTGIIAGTVLGNVGNTGDSEGAHLDWNTYERIDGKMKRVFPTKSTLFGSYLRTEITATTEAIYLSGMETKSIFDNMDKIMEYYKATKEQSFLDDLYQYQIKPITESVYKNNRGLRL